MLGVFFVFYFLVTCKQISSSSDVCEWYGVYEHVYVRG